MRIGIDVGGTNTDAVIIDGQNVKASIKTATTTNVLDGIVTALESMLKQESPEKIESVMLGTTHFANALVEGKRLSKTAVVRLGYPYGQALPPFVNFPEHLKGHMKGPTYILPGGHEFDGREITPFDAGKVEEAAKEIAGAGIHTVAVASPFSPVNSELEQQTADILRRHIPDVQMTMSAEIGSVGLLERENAAILNASLLPLADDIVDALEETLRGLGLECPFYLTQNDGTLMNVDFAKKYPVLTIASGPTNSMRGAAYLSGTEDALVIDVGGTTTDVGVLVNGFPRPAATITEIADVRTNFRMPDVYSLGLGGGTKVQHRSGEKPVIGPESTGSNIREEAYVFGGNTLTMTDVIAAADTHVLGEKENVPLSKGEAFEILRYSEEMVSEIVDRMKPSKEAIPAILVGGGSIIIPQLEKGISDVIRPDHFSVANAIGAAISQVGGEIDQIFSLDGTSRETVVQKAKDEAENQAVAAGADPDTVEIVEFAEVPLAYLPGNASRFLVKAVGDLKGDDAS